jgi:nucleoside-diphosphate-sugar epimerase
MGGQMSASQFDAIHDRILINGANGILGRTILEQKGNENFLAGARRNVSGPHQTIAIDSAGTVTPSLLTGVKAIVNCAGRVLGSPNELHASNVIHPVNLAKTAKASGIKTFVQVSSFSVFGRQELIDEQSPLNPATEYGKSKLEAERELLKLQSTEFQVICARLPFMFGVANPSLMGKLIHILHKSPIFPVTPQIVQRSMLTYTDAAALLVRLAQTNGLSGRINLADPEVFTVTKLLELMHKKQIKAARTVYIPGALAKLVKTVVPSIGERLFVGSFLSESANWAVGQHFPLGLTEGISELLDSPNHNTGNSRY